MTLFVDTSVFVAAADAGERLSARAKRILTTDERLATTDHVLAESWLLIKTRLGFLAARRFWQAARTSLGIEMVTAADLDSAWHLGEAFADQAFSLVDLTSFVVLDRLGLDRAASFDNDFLIIRLGPRRDRALEVIR